MPKPSLIPSPPSHTPSSPLTGIDLHISQSLSRRASLGLLRSLDITTTHLIDFSSNDYLSLSRHPLVQKRFIEHLSTQHPLEPNPTSHHPPPTHGSTGSRLLTGNTTTAISLEHHLAQFHHSPSALLFNSGYDANISLFSTLPPPTSTILHDALIHASAHDGFRTSRATHVHSFQHNNLTDFTWKLQDAIERMEREGNTTGVIVAVESVYSMDGDVGAFERDGAFDGGERGWGTGTCWEMGLEERVFARLHTFGKGVGAHGAVILGPPHLRSYLINYARPLIYSTSLPPHSLIAIQCSYDVMEREADKMQERLVMLIGRWRELMEGRRLPEGVVVLKSETPIQGVVVPGNARVTAVSLYLRHLGIDCRPIRSPTVPTGLERLRVCLHVHNSVEDLEKLVEGLVEGCWREWAKV
ncbi:pyridoxal phosphate-dependent transferase [Chytridium lagenaria]|nr:pyridoxal phosphate-dependent transferase [Chytridium lagenaria]